MDYRVELDVYNGPLDLLLYLIKRDELEIQDIPISQILDSYMSYVQTLTDIRSNGLDIDVAGDFLVMAATLMEIKSAMLLPKTVVAERDAAGGSVAAELADPRQELVRQLLEYKRLKDSASLLDRLRRDQSLRYARFPARPEGAADEPPPVDLEEVQIWDLLESFSQLMREVGARGPGIHEIIDDDTPIGLHAADIEDRLRREGRLTLRGLLFGRRNKSEMIGIFLALLELVRDHKAVIWQGEDLGELEILAAPKVE